LQGDFKREKKAGKLSFERKVELYGEKLEDKFKELEEKLLCREEELLLKGRELQRTGPPQIPPLLSRKGPFFLSSVVADHVLCRFKGRELSVELSSRDNLVAIKQSS
jgi:hypothetical protein